MANKILLNDCKVEFELAKIESRLINDIKAEKYLLSSLIHIPADNANSISDVCTVYDQFLWDTNQWEEAHERLE